MRKHVFFLLCFIAFLGLKAQQNAREFALELQSSYDRSSNKLRVYWPADTLCQRYDVYTKSVNDWTWNYRASLSPYDSLYEIPGYSQGNLVEVWVKKRHTNYLAEGFI
ncbi:MAG: hypothetical protein LPK45_10690, partial [Bacteroidota bacterium]|nr:hypothetical protein [Bacteroidota bacterium]MDX5431566.1 hypothetical protein [Bacteroidota bacterium]MDX5470287.1 hypothetical protein [Bacteroidota bacterium]